jgi:hypothetical protein
MKEADRSEFEVFDGINAMEEAEKVFTTALEKLSICIEMENWDKAEELAYYIKKLTPSDYGDITKSVFRLLLSVRKENHDVSLEIINELMTVINERKCNG